MSLPAVAGQGAHTAQKRTVGHTGGAKHDRAARQLIALEHAIRIVDSHFERPLALAWVAKTQAAFELAAQTLDGTRGDPPSGTPACSHQQINARLFPAGSNARRHIAVADQADAGTEL